MNQLPAVPALGLTLAIPRGRVQRMLETQIAKSAESLRERAASREQMEHLKKLSWDWTLATVNVLKECFFGDAAALHFSSQVYFEPSLKFDDFERDLDEFPLTVKGKVDRLHGMLKALPVIPEPPCGDYIAAQFHPRVYNSTWKQFERAQYGLAIASAVQELEDVVKEFTAGNIVEVGAELIRKAFDPEEGPLIDAESSAMDNQGVADLLIGFMERYKGMSPSVVLDLN